MLSIGLAYAWTGSNPAAYITRLGTGTTSATLDGETITVPFTLFGKIYNSAQGIDNAKFYLIESTNGDATIDQSELDNIKLLVTREDINLDIDNIRLTPRYFMDSSLITEGSKYFLISVAKDLNGDVSCDTSTLAGVAHDGDATHSDSSIRYFIGGGKRP